MVKRIVIIVLLIVTLGLGVLAVYFGYTLSQESQAPEDTEAGGCTPTLTGGVTGCIELPAGCPSYTVDMYWKDAPAGTSDGECVGTSDNKSTATISAGTNCPKDRGPGGCGKCIQLDDLTNNIGAAQYDGCGEEEGKSCPYKSTQIKLQKKAGGAVFNDIADLECGTQFIVGFLHNGNLISSGGDVVATVTGPDGQTIKTITQSGEKVTTNDPGAYTITAKTLTPSGHNFYTEAKCKDTATVTCLGEDTSQCGEACTADSDCTDAGTICNTSAVTNGSQYPVNTCILESCTLPGSNCDNTGCSNEDLASCSEACSSDSDCGTSGTICNGDNITDSRYPANTCVLESCTDTAASCTTNGCAGKEIPELPETAIIDDQSDKILAAVIVILAGILLVKFDVKNIARNWIKKILHSFQTGKLAYLTAPISSKAKKELTDKKKDKFEDKIQK